MSGKLESLESRLAATEWWIEQQGNVKCHRCGHFFPKSEAVIAVYIRQTDYYPPNIEPCHRTCMNFEIQERYYDAGDFEIRPFEAK